MEQYDIRIVTEAGPDLQVLVEKGRRFALVLPAGTDPPAYATASSVHYLPTTARTLLDPVEAIGFLTWVRFAGRHYGMIVCVCQSDMASVVSGLLRRLSGLSDAPTAETSALTLEATRLADILWPLVGTQYTTVEEFRLLIAELRQKCPWDRQQTHVSLLDTLLEESYEVALAIQRGSAENLEEELGDLLLQVFIQSEIAREEDGFDICDVVRTVDDKLTFRHPHVFGSATVASSDQVLENWQKLKALEGRKKHFVDSAKLLSSIENALLSQETARADGFDFESADQAYGKLLEESRELGEELNAAPRDEGALAMELGDVLFSTLNVARLSDVNPVKALRHSFDKFRDRYDHVRTYAAEQQVDIATASPSELERLWQLAKKGMDNDLPTAESHAGEAGFGQLNPEESHVSQPGITVDELQPVPPAPERPKVTNVWSIVWKLLGALGFGALGFFALSLISHQMNVVKVVESMNPGYILAALVLIFLEIVFQALRLQAILRSVGLRIGFTTAMRNILVGEFFARVTPFEAGGGEPAQIYMLFKDDSINVADSTMVFAIKAILAGASQMVVLVFVPIWLFFSGRSLGVGNRFRLVLYIGIAAYVANFGVLVYCLIRLKSINDHIERLVQRPAGTLNARGRFWQRLARRVQKFVKDTLRARETAVKANRPLLVQGLAYSFVSWGVVVLTPIILLYGLGVTSSITQIIVATLIYYIAVSYFPTPGASVGAELGAVALFAAFVPNGILGAFILIWRFFDHYIKMGAGGITALGEFVLGPARRRRRHRRAEEKTSAKEGTTKP